MNHPQMGVGKTKMTRKRIERNIRSYLIMAAIFFCALTRETDYERGGAYSK